MGGHASPVGPTAWARRKAMSPLPVHTSRTHWPSAALLHFTAICFQTQCCPRLSMLFICTAAAAHAQVCGSCALQHALCKYFGIIHRKHILSKCDKYFQISWRGVIQFLLHTAQVKCALGPAESHGQVLNLGESWGMCSKHCDTTLQSSRGPYAAAGCASIIPGIAKSSRLYLV